MPGRSQVPATIGRTAGGGIDAARVRSVWAWTGWASWPVSRPALWAAGAVVGLDIASAWSGVPGWRLGRVAISPALPVAAFLIVSLARARHRERPAARPPAWCAWWEFVVGGVAACVAVGVFLAPAVGTGEELAGLLFAVAGEEVVFRLAVLLVAGAACAWASGHEWHDTARWGAGPAVAGLAASALSFTLLPGHVDQITGWSTAVPFGSLAVLLGYTVLRTGTILPAVVVHTWLDLVGLAHLGGVVPGSARAGLAATGLVALVCGLMRAGRRLGLRRRVPTEIDLRVSAGPSSRGRRDRHRGPLRGAGLPALAVPGTGVARGGRELLDVGPES